MLPVFLRPFVVAVFLLPVFACGPTDLETGLESDDELSADSSELGFNAWQHQAGLNLSCADEVSNSVSTFSRRHFYSYPGEAKQTVTFELNGSWPANLGAVIIIKDLSGKVLASYSTPSYANAKVDVTFATTGKHFVYASPYRYWKVNQKRGYTLKARCHAPTCSADSDCGPEEMCSIPVCITTPCDLPGTCVVRPVQCASLTLKWDVSTDTTYVYAKNVASAADAADWFTFFPANAQTAVTNGPCNQHLGCIEIFAPVCGAIRSEPVQTYSNSCDFSAAVKSSAGGQVGVESKGYYTSAACSVP